jgi:hypothetical protein
VKPVKRWSTGRHASWQADWTRHRSIGFAALVAGTWPCAPAEAAQDNPDFYATIIAIATDHRSITVSPTKDQIILVDVRELGSAPFDIGAFALNNVIVLRTKRVGDALVATGWEQARNGEEESAHEGIENLRERQERVKEDNDKEKPDKN